MITYNEALENPELMIKYKDMFKNIKIYEAPWYWVFEKYPYLYREFSDRCDEMESMDITRALVRNPALALDLRDYLHGVDEEHVGMVAHLRPNLSLCMKYKDNPDKIEAAYYVGYPRELDDLNREEKREIGKRILELLREEKM